MLIKAKEKITKSYDVIIVGSGLAGMTAANKLGRNGRKVLLLESHNKLGGFATWFKRRDGDHIFDVSWRRRKKQLHIFLFLEEPQ